MGNGPEPIRLTPLRVAQLLLPAASILLCLAVHRTLPNVYPEGYEPTTYAPFLLLCLSLYLAFFVAACLWERLRKKCSTSRGFWRWPSCCWRRWTSPR